MTRNGLRNHLEIPLCLKSECKTFVSEMAEIAADLYCNSYVRCPEKLLGPDVK